MRRGQYTLSPAVVCGLAVQTLGQGLASLPRPRSVPAECLIRLLVHAAAQMRSLWAVCQEARLPRCPETIRLAVRSWLPAVPAALLPGLLAALHHRLPKALARRPRVLAIDLHHQPYYGDRRTPGTVRGQPKLGTKTFFAYATALVVHKGQSYTVGLLPVRAGLSYPEILAALLAQAAAGGLRPKVVLLDRGFYGAPAITWLQENRLAFVMPMIRRGRAGQTKAECTGNQRFFARRRPGWDRYTWTWRAGPGRPARPVTVDVCMGGPRRRAVRPWVYACGGLGGRDPDQVVRLYRRRFQIETSYRQMREGLAKTCSTSAVLRLLLIGIGLVLRNLWVWLHWERLSRIEPTRRVRRLAVLRLRTMLRWIAEALDGSLGKRRCIDLDAPPNGG
jgi:Transposase DDE domain